MIATEERARAIIEQALAHQVASSISLWVGFEKESLFTIHAGYSQKGFATDHNTIYDLASLTKILGTALAVAKACTDGAISLYETPFAAWPQVRVKDLLAHTSSLPAHRHFYLEQGVKRGRWSQNRSIMFNALYETSIAGVVPSAHHYSDLNFLALGALLEERLHKPLIAIMRNAWQKAEMAKSLSYFASDTHGDDDFVVPTGHCKLRGQHLRAQVHDLNCFFLGGLSGHAGLFGTLPSVALVGQFFLSCYKSPRNAYQSMVRHFIKNSLAFHRPTPEGSIRFLSPSSFGHFGYTGTSLWIDPHAQGGLIYILLTNRVEKSEKPEPIFGLREKIHRLFSRSI